MFFKQPFFKAKVKKKAHELFQLNCSTENFIQETKRKLV